MLNMHMSEIILSRIPKQLPLKLWTGFYEANYDATFHYL